MRYIKCMLTIIAIALVVIACNDLTTSATALDKQMVIIVDNYGTPIGTNYNPLIVKSK